MNNIELYNGDCLEVMKQIPDGSVDMILCDLPFGTTAQNKWDSIIPFEPLWNEYDRVIKDNGAVALFSQMPFGSKLIESNLKHFRYEWIWKKSLPQGFLNANKMPMRSHENILIFYKKLPTYNPQKRQGKPYDKGIRKANSTTNYGNHKECRGENKTGERFPEDVIFFSNADHHNKLHPTQKPVDLLEYLIKTYTNEGEVVLDNAFGSCSTGVACINTNRNFIGIEKDEGYFNIGKERLAKAMKEVNNE